MSNSIESIILVWLQQRSDLKIVEILEPSHLKAFAEENIPYSVAGVWYSIIKESLARVNWNEIYATLLNQSSITKL